MTREEAIAILKRYRHFEEDNGDIFADDAIDMAISALKDAEHYTKRYESCQCIINSLHDSIKTYHNIFLADQKELRKTREKIKELEKKLWESNQR